MTNEMQNPFICQCTLLDRLSKRLGMPVYISSCYLIWRQSRKSRSQSNDWAMEGRSGTYDSCATARSFSQRLKGFGATVILDHDAVSSQTASGPRVPEISTLGLQGDTEILSKTPSPLHGVYASVTREIGHCPLACRERDKLKSYCSMMATLKR